MGEVGSDRIGSGVGPGEEILGVGVPADARHLLMACSVPPRILDVHSLQSRDILRLDWYVPWRDFSESW